MKRILMLCAACALLLGCDYSVPLVTTPDTPLDEALVGLWQKPGAEGKTESVLVLPWSPKEFLVIWSSGSEDALLARASLWNRPPVSLIQLDWFGHSNGTPVTNSNRYQYAVGTVKSGKLTVQMLNTEVVPKDAASSEALARVILDDHKHPKLFRKGTVYRKAKK